MSPARSPLALLCLAKIRWRGLRHSVFLSLAEGAGDLDRRLFGCASARYLTRMLTVVRLLSAPWLPSLLLGPPSRLKSSPSVTNSASWNDRVPLDCRSLARTGLSGPSSSVIGAAGRTPCLGSKPETVRWPENPRVGGLVSSPAANFRT